MRFASIPFYGRQYLGRHCFTYSLLLGGTFVYPLLASQAMAESTVQRFAVAAGPVDNALSQFASQANVILSFSPTQTGNRRTQGLQGQYSI
ncbi:hypothetical protein, partial [Pandoraea sputorum]